MGPKRFLQEFLQKITKVTKKTKEFTAEAAPGNNFLQKVTKVTEIVELHRKELLSFLEQCYVGFRYLKSLPILSFFNLFSQTIMSKRFRRFVFCQRIRENRQSKT